MICPFLPIYYRKLKMVSCRLRINTYTWAYGVWTDMGRYRLWPVYLRHVNPSFVGMP